MRRAALALVALALLAVGCCEKEESLDSKGADELELLLDYFPNADHAGIYAAQAAGRFEDVGLKVKIRTPSDPAAPIKQVAAGRVDLAISYEPEVLRARAEGVRVISIGALVQRPLTSIISLPKAGIERPADLRGKRVGTAGIDYQSAYLRTILKDAGVPPKSVKERNVGFGLTPALLTKKVDAVLGAFWNYEGTELRLRKKRPRIIRVDQAGVPPYDELVLVANEDALERDAPKIRRFIAGLARGTRDLQKQPGKAIEGLLEANRDLDEKLQREAVRVTLPSFLPPRGRPYGWQDTREWRDFGRWMRQNELIERPIDAADGLTNDLLPGEGP